MKRLALAVLLFAPSAAAATTAGGNLTIAPVSGTTTVRWPAIAHDGGRYLAISGAGKVTGQLIGDDGAPIGAPFPVNAGSNLAQAPRVSPANGKFLVTWHETIGSATRIRGRLVAASGPTGDDFDISTVGTNWEMGAASALLKNELLVAWQNPSNAIVAQRVSDTGTLIGGPIPIDSTGRYQRDPTVVSNGSEYIVVYAGCVADKNCFVEAQRVRDGMLLGDRLVLDSAIDAGYVPEADYNSTTGEVLVVWYGVTSAGKGFHARTIRKDGTLGAVTPFTTIGSYDAAGLAYNARSNTFLFVTHGDTSQDVAMELSSTGALLNTTPFGPIGTGNFNPRVAASASKPEWIAVTSFEFKHVSAQRFVTDPVAMPDSGVVVDSAVPDTAVARDTATTSDVGPGDPGPVEGSCGCSVQNRQPPGALAVLIGLLSYSRRRRQGCLSTKARRRASTPRPSWRRAAPRRSPA